MTWLALLNRDDMPEACQDTLRKAAAADPPRRRAAGHLPSADHPDQPAQSVYLRQPRELESGLQSARRKCRRRSIATAISATRSARRSRSPTIFNGKWERLDSQGSLHARDEAAGRAHGRRNRAASAARTASIPSSTSRSKTICNIQFTMALFNANEDRIPELISDPRTMIGLSDGGAHVDMLCDAGYCTYLLGTWVRERRR